LAALEKRLGNNQQLDTVWQIMRVVSILRHPCTRCEICDILGLDVRYVSGFREIEEFVVPWALLHDHKYVWAESEFGVYLLRPERTQFEEFLSLDRKIIEYVERRVATGISQGEIFHLFSDFCPYYEYIGARRELLLYVRTTWSRQFEEQGYLHVAGRLLSEVSLIAKAEESVSDALFCGLLFACINHRKFFTSPRGFLSSPKSVTKRKRQFRRAGSQRKETARIEVTKAAREFVEGRIDRSTFFKIIAKQPGLIKTELECPKPLSSRCDELARLWTGTN
jgi:hypothetical protein